MSSVDYRPPRSPLAPESSRSASPSGSGASSPPYLRMHSSRAHQTPLSISTSLASPTRSTAPVSPGRAQTHRTLGQFPFPADPAGHPSHPRPAGQGYGQAAGPSHLSQQIDRDHSATPPPRVNHSSLTTPSASAPATTGYSPSLASPCFVHTHLDHTLHNVAKRDSGSPFSGDKGELYLRGRKKPRAKPSESAKDATAKRLGEDGASSTPPVPEQAAESESGSEEDSDDEKNNWTRQLAETAVSVREMSKQLGRARVVSHIQSVMIVTKARDNQLTRLTRELALWLMQTPRNGKDRGLIVYVDSQLRKSKRFDAAGIEREHPELLRPLPNRRYSRTASSASLATETGPLRAANGASTPARPGALTPLTMTNLGEALLKRNNSITSVTGDSTHPAKKGADGEEGQLRYWTNEMCRKSPHLFDFVITLGGDGTVLYTSWLFQQIVPPVIPFALGSLGFLTNFDYAHFRETLDAAIETGVRVNLRMRFTCTVYRAVEDESVCRRRAIRSGKTGGIFMKSLTREGWDAIESGKPLNAPGGRDKEIKCFSTRAVESFEVLNDLVVDRGPSPYVSQLELFGDEHHMTTVQADGLTVSTPTGSTAYSLSAGGSLVHPEIPAILITPICPHTLSFRPMLLPDSMELRICVPYNSRSTAWASFDGRGRVELKQGDHIKVTASPYPFPTVCADKQSTDWFHSIARTLKWNERERQKSFVILEEGRKKPRSSSGTASEKQKVQPTSPSAAKSASPRKHATFAADPCQGGDRGAEEEPDAVDEEDEEGDDESDDTAEEYDIDDVSENTTNASSPSISPSDPAHAHVPSIHTVSSASPPASSHFSQAHSMSPRDADMVSNASSIDIQDDLTERFRTVPPRGRSRSRTRSSLEQRHRRSQDRQGGSEEEEKSQDRAFAVLGHDEDDESSQQSESDY
ncbi:hypothetical protein JCM10049v2_004175 [Rhodotorula toruloides]